MGKCIDLTGQKFNYLIVIKRVENSSAGQVRYLCKCECGEQVIVQVANLKNGNSKSCGCRKKKLISQKNTSHGLANTRLDVIYNNMQQRCLNPNSPRYKDYGARGIVLCEEWLKRKNFFKWALENGYNDNLTIDRIDNNKGYSPDNCRWVDIKTQQNNKRNNHLATINGETKNLKSWADEFKINYQTLLTRLNRGWTLERALTKQVHSK